MGAGDGHLTQQRLRGKCVEVTPRAQATSRSGVYIRGFIRIRVRTVTSCARMRIDMHMEMRRRRAGRVVRGEREMGKVRRETRADTFRFGGVAAQVWVLARMGVGAGLGGVWGWRENGDIVRAGMAVCRRRCLPVQLTMPIPVRMSRGRERVRDGPRGRLAGACGGPIVRGTEVEDGDEATVVRGGGVTDEGEGSGGAMGHLYRPHRVRLVGSESRQLEQVLALAWVAVLVLLFIVVLEDTLDVGGGTGRRGRDALGGGEHEGGHVLGGCDCALDVRGGEECAAGGEGGEGV